MTDYLDQAATAAACVANAITESVKDGVTAAGLGAVYTTLATPADAVVATAIAASPEQIAAAAFAAISPKKHVVMFGTVATGIGGLAYGATTGCFDGMQQQQINALVAKTVAAQTHMTAEDKASAMEAAAKISAAPGQLPDQGISK